MNANHEYTYRLSCGHVVPFHASIPNLDFPCFCFHCGQDVQIVSITFPSRPDRDCPRCQRYLRFVVQCALGESR